ncbi:MAG: 5-bromo-4-chloroindolyl phosphate hydrolysis family protein, partial [Paracoccaceae bacterium]|nr:5-bromo-4-chloroindolyl phosphate hydrolysis family protein [Paracoccaceae bacterium]
VNFLFFPPLILILKAFTSEPIVMATYLAALGLLLLAAWLIREGLFAQEAFESRKVARRPAIPRKLFGAILTGAGLSIAGLAGHGPVEAIIFGVLGLGLHVAAFGFDPMKSKGMGDVDEFQNGRVVRAIEEAEAHLAAMQKSIASLNDRDLVSRVERFQSTARHMFRVIEADPRDLTAVRKYLSVYLDAARQASTKFADLYARNHNADARKNYETLLEDLEQSFGSRTQKMLADDHVDLDIEIDVLRARLEREGVKLASD